jgi:hypothetical protein
VLRNATLTGGHRLSGFIRVGTNVNLAGPFDAFGGAHQRRVGRDQEEE